MVLRLVSLGLRLSVFYIAELVTIYKTPQQLRVETAPQCASWQPQPLCNLEWHPPIQSWLFISCLLSRGYMSPGVDLVSQAPCHYRLFHGYSHGLTLCINADYCWVYAVGAKWWIYYLISRGLRCILIPCTASNEGFWKQFFFFFWRRCSTNIQLSTMDFSESEWPFSGFSIVRILFTFSKTSLQKLIDRNSLKIFQSKIQVLNMSGVSDWRNCDNFLSKNHSLIFQMFHLRCFTNIDAM